MYAKRIKTCCPRTADPKRARLDPTGARKACWRSADGAGTGKKAARDALNRAEDGLRSAMPASIAKGPRATERWRANTLAALREGAARFAGGAVNAENELASVARGKRELRDDEQCLEELKSQQKQLDKPVVGGRREPGALDAKAQMVADRLLQLLSHEDTATAAVHGDGGESAGADALEQAREEPAGAEEKAKVLEVLRSQADGKAKERDAVTSNVAGAQKLCARRTHSLPHPSSRSAPPAAPRGQR
eukprot:g1246.t1